MHVADDALGVADVDAGDDPGGEEGTAKSQSETGLVSLSLALLFWLLILFLFSDFVALGQKVIVSIFRVQIY